MFITIHANAEIASNSLRQHQENIDVDMNDTIDTVKVKVTLVYTQLDPESFYLEFEGRRCLDTDTILALRKRATG